MYLSTKYSCPALVVESTTVTHSSADWWDPLLPLAWHQIEGTDGFYGVSSERHWQGGVNGIAKVESSEAMLSAVGFEPVPHRPVASAIQRSNFIFMRFLARVVHWRICLSGQWGIAYYLFSHKGDHVNVY